MAAGNEILYDQVYCGVYKIQWIDQLKKKSQGEILHYVRNGQNKNVNFKTVWHFIMHGWSRFYLNKKKFTNLSLKITEVETSSIGTHWKIGEKY